MKSTQFSFLSMCVCVCVCVCVGGGGGGGSTLRDNGTRLNIKMPSYQFWISYHSKEPIESADLHRLGPRSVKQSI